MIYHQLARHQWRIFLHSFAWRRHWGVALFRALFGLYVAVALVLLGFLWKEMVPMVRPGVEPVALLNRHLVTIFIALFTLRFFVQRTPRLKIQPYLHLPVSRIGLVGFYQISSLATIHNVFPFLFFFPLWARHINGGPYTPIGAWGWLGGIVLLLLLSHYGNTLLRTLMSRSREGLFIVFGVLLLLVSTDLLVGPGAVNAVSVFIFDTLVAERPVILLLLSALLAVVFALSGSLLEQNLFAEPSAGRGRIVLWQMPFLAPRHGLFNFVLLELKLIWRSERPKLYFFLSVVLATIYVAVPLVHAEFAGSNIARALALLFASGIFALNYGQFMFAWESSYFDGLLARPLPLWGMVVAKMMVLQGSCVLFFLFSSPVFLILAPEFLPLHLAFLFYNAGVTTILTMILALQNRKRIELANVGFTNYEGFSLLHWLWFIPTVVPPAVLLYALPEHHWLVPLLIGGAGGLSLVFMRGWITVFVRQLERMRYEMAAGFRRSI